jgi:hypothetical protein
VLEKRYDRVWDTAIFGDLTLQCSGGVRIGALRDSLLDKERGIVKGIFFR